MKLWSCFISKVSGIPSWKQHSKAGLEYESEGYEAVMELSRQVGKLTASVIPYFQLNQ